LVTVSTVLEEAHVSVLAEEPHINQQWYYYCHLFLLY